MSTVTTGQTRTPSFTRTLGTIASLGAIVLLGMLAYGQLQQSSPSLPAIPLVGQVFAPKHCSTPITYRLGSFDSRFGISQEYFLSELRAAAGVWGVAEGKPLFVYDPKGTLEINLVYDDRQAAVQLGKTISNEQQTYDALKPQYDAAQQTYLTAQAEYIKMQDAYNKEVDYWNARGGAPKAEFDKLTRMKADLVTYSASLDQARAAANALAAQLNAKADSTNQKVNAYNHSSIVGTDFDEGVYQSDGQGTRINIYEFTNGKALEHIMEHEFGHALGLDHNQNPVSVMYPQQNDSLALSPDDLAALNVVCGK